MHENSLDARICDSELFKIYEHCKSLR